MTKAFPLNLRFEVLTTTQDTLTSIETTLSPKKYFAPKASASLEN